MNATMSPSLTMRIPTTCAVNVIGHRRGRGGSDDQTKFSEEVEKLQKTYEKLSKEKDETKERATQGRNHAPARWRRGGTHWFKLTGINDDDFKFAKAVKKAAAKASATDEL